MVTLDLTQDELEELISAESHMYMDYDEERSQQYNESIRRYNDSVEALLNKMKLALQQAKEQDECQQIQLLVHQVYVESF